jgi:hypothetical protein
VTFKREAEELVLHGIESGIDEQIMRSIADPKLINYMYKHMKQDKSLENAKPVVKPPKTLKARAVKNTKQGRKAKVDNAVTAAVKSHDMRLKTSAVSALLSGE